MQNLLALYSSSAKGEAPSGRPPDQRTFGRFELQGRAGSDELCAVIGRIGFRGRQEFGYGRICPRPARTKPPLGLPPYSDLVENT